MVFILSNVGAYEMLLRPAYLLGALAPIVTGLIFSVRDESRKRDGITNMLLLMMLLILIYMTYMYLRWHNSYF